MTRRFRHQLGLKAIEATPTSTSGVRSGRRWHALSRAFRAAHPICQRCDDRFSMQVHHRIPVEQRPDLAFDVDNLEALCVACHERAHGKREHDEREAAGGVSGTEATGSDIHRRHDKNIRDAFTSSSYTEELCGM